MKSLNTRLISIKNSTIRWKLILAMLVVIWACPQSFSDPHPAWKQLNLHEANVAGATIYYEKCFEPNLPVFERAYKEIKQKTEQEVITIKKEDIVADINRIVGAVDPNTQAQCRVLDTVIDLIGQMANAEHTFYITKTDTIKNILRSGCQLPNLEYDMTIDEATYQPAFEFTSSQPLKAIELMILIDSNESFKDGVSKFLKVLDTPGGIRKVGVAIHELTEVTILSRLKPRDMKWRWFTDGFAEAITCELLRKHYGVDAAADWASIRDVRKYDDLQKEVNLMYWLSVPYCVRPTLECEQRLSLARYAYATHEAQRLIERYGLDCVRKILDKVCTLKYQTSQDLLYAIKNVTGEDMQDRLHLYQTFRKKKEGIDKYNVLFEVARQREDYEQMLINLTRKLELSPFQFLPVSLKLRKQIALTLFKLGEEKSGDQTMLDVLQRLRQPGIIAIYDYFSEQFLDYALECDNPHKARKIAEEVLTKYPNSPSGQTVNMRLLADSGNLDEAGRVAAKILLFTDADSLYHISASEILWLSQKRNSYASK